MVLSLFAQLPLLSFVINKAEELKPLSANIMNSGNKLLETVSPKSSVSDKDSENSNGFVTIDLEALPCDINNKDTNPNSVTALQRKGWSDKEVNAPAAAFHDWIVIPLSTSPRACCVASTPEKVEAPVVGSGNNGGSPGVHHQITVTVNTMGNEDNSMARRNSSFNFKRPSNNWSLPCKVFVCFTTMSCMGTILMMIYITFLMTSHN